MGSFYIIKVSIYMHGVYGPYESKEQAMQAFQDAYKNSKYYDFDGHHDYYVVENLNDKIGEDMEWRHGVKYRIDYEPRSADGKGE